MPLDTLPERPRAAYERLRTELSQALADDLVAIWAYGSLVGADRPQRPADLDAHVVLRRRPDPALVRGIEQAMNAIKGMELDVWFITLEDAGRAEEPRHAFREGRRDTSWAIHRAHWLAGRVVVVQGPKPSEIVAEPSWTQIVRELDRELEHIERHIHEGDTDPYEASYAVLNGSRILRTLEIRDPVLSKREAGTWAREHLPARWHPALEAALRAYDERQTPDDEKLLATEMARFIAMVREQLPPTNGRGRDQEARWSGY